MIIAHHYYTKGGLAQFAGTSVANKYVILLLGQGGKAAVMLLVLITGYFCVRIDCRPYHLLRLECAMQFYSLVFFGIACLTGAETFKLTGVVKSIMPLTFSRYWFMTVYCLLYLVLPYMNKGLLMLDKKEHRRLLWFALSMFYIMPLLNRIAFRRIHTDYTDLVWSTMLWFLNVYLFGAYVGRFYRARQKGSRPWLRLLIGIALYAGGVVAEVLTDLIGKDPEKSQFVYELLFSEESMLMLASMILIFLFVKDLKLGSKKWINIPASTVLGVYLIHENEYMRSFLWGWVYRYEGFQPGDNALLLLIRTLVIVFVIFLGCMAVDLLRMAVLEKPFIPKARAFLEEKMRKLEEAHE